MPYPRPQESKDDFISRFMSSEEAKKDYPSEEQRVAVAHSMWEEHQKKKDGKEIKYRNFGIKLIEEDGEFYSEGWVATTHPDRAADSELGVDGDILAKEVMNQIADFINSTIATTKDVGSTRAVSYRHDWVKARDPNMEPAGMTVPPAEVKEYVNEKGEKDGHFGVWVKVHHNKNHPKFEEILYEVKHGYLPGYSIEYQPGEFSKIRHEGKIYRFLKSITNYVGHAFAHARMIANPMAVITGFGYKELVDKEQEENSMEEVKEAPITEPLEQPEVKEVVEPKVEEKEVKEEVKETNAQPEVSMKELAEKVIESKEFKEAMESMKVENKTLKTKGEAPMNINIKEMNEAFAKGDLISAKEAALEYAKESDILLKAMNDPKSYTSGFNLNLNVKVADKGLKISGSIPQTKDTLVIGDNTSSYTQQNVELADVFAPGIIDTFNNQTNLFGFLKKEQHIGGSHYQWKIVTNRDPNSVSTFVAQTDVNVIKNFSNKVNLQTPIKIARRGVSVSDFINRYSARSLPDLFQLELDLQMKEMMKDVNAALFAEVADGTGNAPLGLEAVADSAGNTTLYGLTRSTANRLAPDSAGDTYLAVGGAITEAAMRTKISYLESAGVPKGNIVIVASPTTRDLLFNLLDGQRQFITTEAAFGFNRMKVPVYDGIPIVVDSDCNSDAIYFIDTDSDVIVVGMAPQIVSLAKVGAGTEAYVQMDFAHVYKEPRKIGMLDTLS